MATFDRVLKEILGVNHIILESSKLMREPDGTQAIYLNVRPYKRESNLCPHCGRVCPKYDHGNSSTPRRWRSLDWGGLRVYLCSETHRVVCPDHGVVTASVPWAFERSGFTKQFDYTAAWFAREVSTTALSTYLRVDWKTVGRCLRRVLNRIEPDRKVRLDGLVNIGVDETSYRKGHNYITVVVNHDTNTVVWMHDGHGKKVFSEFFKSLNDEQLASIKTISGDGARWIDECMSEYVPHAVRCTDPFHVVTWANEMLNDLRRETWRERRQAAQEEMQKAKNCTDSKESAGHKNLGQGMKAVADKVKGALYALGKNPENLTKGQEETLTVIAASEPRLYKAYAYKETLRAILHMTDKDLAENELKRWYFRATHSRMPRVIELAKKIKRHFAGILSAIGYGFNNARIEAINSKIKLGIRRARGFRNFNSLTAMVMLTCSRLVIPLPNRPESRI